MSSEHASTEDTKGESPETKAGGWNGMEILKVVAIPLVTLVLGFLFNRSLDRRQTGENNLRVYTEMMGHREQADSDLRKDMLKSILDTFMKKDPKMPLGDELNQEVLNLELLAYNFHESLDLAPLFKHVRRRIPAEETTANKEMRSRLEKVAQEVVLRQLTVLSDGGVVEFGDAPLQKIDDLQAYLTFGSSEVLAPGAQSGQSVARLCLSMDSSDGVRHYRQFSLELTEYDPHWRELRVRLYVSKVLSEAECRRTDLETVGNKEIDTRFWTGPFDFPMIDNSRLTHDERCAVSLVDLNPPYSVKVAVAYFPGSRASLKDKPFYDDVMHELVPGFHRIPATEH
jgi:hypothetical protein